MSSEITLIPVAALRHIEGFGARRVRWLSQKIREERHWTMPLRVERDHKLVMDGQHRLEAARALGLAVVPCLLYDYASVKVWSLRPNHVVTADLIVQRALENRPYPYKTAKHEFPDGIVACRLPLTELGYKEK